MKLTIILDSLNCWSARKFHNLFANSGMSIVRKDISKYITIQGADTSEEFKILKERYPEEDFTTNDMILHLRKKNNLDAGHVVINGLNIIFVEFYNILKVLFWSEHV